MSETAPSGKRVSKNPSPPLPDGLLTLAEAAAFLRIHPRTVKVYVKRRLLNGRLIGRQWRFRGKDLDALYESAPSSWEPSEHARGKK